jgi:hypothetical protein
VNLARGVAIVLAATMGLAQVQTPAIEPQVESVLKTFFGFTPSDIGDVERGRIVRRTIPTSTPGEIAVVGALRVHASKKTFVDRVRDMATFKRGPEILQIGVFGNPPSIDDLAGLTVGPEDFDPDDCRVHDCNIRIPADAIERIERAMEGGVARDQARAAALFKALLVEHVRAYLTGGTGRMRQYDDGDKPIRPENQFAGILANAPVLRAVVPGMAEHLSDPASHPLEGAEDIVYWSKEKFGFAPFITVTHAAIVCPSPALCVVASRDVYSSRYIDASLAMTLAADVPSMPGTFDLVYMNRSRASALKGMFGGLRRSIAERRAKGGLEETLKRLRQSLEKG